MRLGNLPGYGWARTGVPRVVEPGRLGSTSTPPASMRLGIGFPRHSKLAASRRCGASLPLGWAARCGAVPLCPAEWPRPPCSSDNRLAARARAAHPRAQRAGAVGAVGAGWVRSGSSYVPRPPGQRRAYRAAQARTVEAAAGALLLLGPCLGAGMFVWRQCVSLDGECAQPGVVRVRIPVAENCIVPRLQQQGRRGCLPGGGKGK